MSQSEKLLQKVKGLSKDIRFGELKKVLEIYGYHMDRPKSGSSHCTFRKQGKMPITIPVHRPIKAIYIRMVKDVIEEEDQL